MLVGNSTLMASKKNSLTLDYRDLPDLKAALGGLTPGDRCSVCFDLMVTANGDERLEGTVEEVEYECEGEEEEMDSGSAEPTADEPVMVAVVARNMKKSKKPEKEDEEDADTDE